MFGLIDKVLREATGVEGAASERVAMAMLRGCRSWEADMGCARLEEAAGMFFSDLESAMKNVGSEKIVIQDQAAINLAMTIIAQLF